MIKTLFALDWYYFGWVLGIVGVIILVVLYNRRLKNKKSFTLKPPQNPV